jgi:hypothetical protein
MFFVVISDPGDRILYHGADGPDVPVTEDPEQELTMSESTSAVLEAPVVTETPKSPAKPKAAKKPAAKKAPAPKGKAKPKAKAEKSVAARETPDLPPRDRRINVVKALRQLRATSATAARSLDDVAAKAGTTKYDVYGVISGHSGKAGSSPSCLIATGHAKVADVEGQGLSVYLTKRGQETKFDDYPFARPSSDGK